VEVQEPQIVEPSIPSIEVPPPIAIPAPIDLSLPVIDMPCALTREKETGGKDHFNNDPDGNVALCDHTAPWFFAPDYSPGVKIIRNEPPKTSEQPNQEPLTPPQPEVPKIASQEEKKTPCPDETKNNPRIGDISASGKEKVSGFELRDGTCVVTYSPVTAIETYLPRSGVVTTTSLIASAAVVSSVLAKPLADLLLKIIKPSVKKLITTVQTKIFRKPEKVVSYHEKLMLQRERNRAVRKLKKGW